jgi:drug/metabolite transporter (DMT)-like permease
VRIGAEQTRDISPVRRHGLEVALIAVAALWGFTFVMVKEAVERVPPFEFLALRFSLAAVVLTGVFWRQIREMGRDGLRAGVIAGSALCTGYAFQTVGLQYTTATNAGFVTGLFVVFTPILSTVLLRRRPSLGPVIGVVLATVGLALLSLTDTLQVRRGDPIVLMAALSFSVQVVLLGRYSPRHSPAALTTVQMWVAALVSTGVAAGSADFAVPDASVWWAVLVMGLLASAAAFFIQTLAQRYVPPTRTAVILVSEPAFAGLAGFLLLDEILSARGWIGAGLILAGMLVAELSPQRSKAEG